MEVKLPKIKLQGLFLTIKIEYLQNSISYIYKIVTLGETVQFVYNTCNEYVTTEKGVPPNQSINQPMLRVVRIVSYIEKILLITRTLRKPSKRDITMYVRR